MLIKERKVRKTLAEFLSKAFELIATVFIVLKTCIFSVNS